MYEFVTDAEVSEYRSYCADILVQLRDNLLDLDINTQFVLVGSGARNMVTRNGNGPFDLDYNLVILSMPEEYWNNLRRLKDLVRSELNKIVRRTCFSDGKDSTSVITALISDHSGVQFKFDVAIIRKNSNGNYCRLVHDKTGWNDRLYWTEVPSSHNVKNKAYEIKKKGMWLDVRDAYLDLKDMYLLRHDTDHPSFICYIEAVNTVHARISKKKKK